MDLTEENLEGTCYLEPQVLLEQHLRPSGYHYWKQLKEHLGSSSKIFNGKLTYPRQLEIHLPSNHLSPCNFDCFHCAGKKFIKDLGMFEMDGLELLQNLNGAIPYHIYGGSYTEMVNNPYFMTFLHMTKRTNCHFGIHTNGSLLKRLEEEQGWLHELCRIATDKIDYLSVSLDAGAIKSHCLTKNIKHDWFSEILEGVKLATEIRHEKPAIRLCYLMNQFNSSQEEIDSIVQFAKECEVDSLRFSIPFAHYAQDFSIVRKYKWNIEQKHKHPYYMRIKKHLSEHQSEQPFIFWMSPDLQDIDLFDFTQCAYGYYQICLGADGYVYRCTTVSTPTFRHLRLGKTTSSLEQFNRMILANQNPHFNVANECFKHGARCNRMGLEINRAWRNLKCLEC